MIDNDNNNNNNTTIAALLLRLRLLPYYNPQQHSHYNFAFEVVIAFRKPACPTLLSSTTPPRCSVQPHLTSPPHCLRLFV